jgi:DNA-binding transcriptional MerR regulator
MALNDMKILTIGGVSALVSCKIETIRFYEQMGLLPPPMRSAGGQRRYDERSVKRLQFIRHAREMGFDLDAIRELLALAESPAETCAGADAIARRHLIRVREKIRRLRKLEKELVAIVHEGRHGTVAECRVLEVLADHKKA